MSDNEVLEVDARRLLCPLPVIRTQNFVENCESGAIVRVISTDPGALADIPSWCRINGHEIVAIEDRGDENIITVKVQK